MKTIIAGNGDISNFGLVHFAISRSGFADQITEVVSGKKKVLMGGGVIASVDFMAETWANERNIPVKGVKADYLRFKKFAPKVQNIHKMREGDALIVIHDGTCDVSDHMLTIAKKKGMKTFEFFIDKKPLK